jgi:tripartite-type tricarboxylate transporter receptor subunit TctC
MLDRRFFIATSAAALATSVRAQSAWPQRAVKLIIPFGPGAGADIGARMLSDKLAQRWGKPVVVENRPGGDGMLAVNAFLGAGDDMC